MCCEKAHESGQSSLILDRKTEWVPADKPAAAGTQSGASRGEPGNLNWVDHRAGPETGPHNNTASIHKPTHGRLQQVGFLPASLPLLSFLINHRAPVLPDRCDIYIWQYYNIFLTFSRVETDKQAVNSLGSGCVSGPPRRENMAAVLSGPWLSWSCETLQRGSPYSL